MPITVEIVDPDLIGEDREINSEIFKEIFDYFRAVDQKFSPYKRNSELSQINAGKINIAEVSEEMKNILKLADVIKKETNGYFDIFHNSKLDTSGIVKGWAINNAAKILRKKGIKNFYIDAGGDIEASGKNSTGEIWKVGIRNPFNRFQNVKVLKIFNKGIATSGTAIRGKHIYNPHKEVLLDDIVSLTVVGPNVYEADLLATAAFAMQRKGIYFLENKKNFEGYMIDNKGIATFTSGFEEYVL